MELLFHHTTMIHLVRCSLCTNAFHRCYVIWEISSTSLCPCIILPQSSCHNLYFVINNYNQTIFFQLIVFPLNSIQLLIHSKLLK